jgi:hypothetical protein
MMPPEIEREMANDASAIAVDNLRAVVECRTLLHVLERAGVSVLFVKGLTLGALAYGTATIKAAVDIDLLISPENLPKAASVLRNSKYALMEPSGGFDPHALARWHKIKKESLWLRPDNQLQLDLHTRLSDNQLLIPGIDTASATQTVEVAPGIGLPTLRTRELFAYLCVHGASSAWFRLKWITDLAALLHPMQPEALESLYSASQALGAARAPAQALLLADALYGTLSRAPQLRERLTQDAANNWLFRAALNQLTGSGEPIEPTARLFGTVRIHLSQLALMPGWRFKFSESRRQLGAVVARFR